MFSWIIEHVIGNVPVWMWAFVAGGGAGAYIVSGFITKIPNPSIKSIAFIIKIAGIVALLYGTFMSGSAGVTSVLQAELKEMQGKLAVAQQQSADANTALVSALKNKKNSNQQVRVVIQQRIIHDAVKMDANCKVDPVAIGDLNDAATNKGSSK